MVGMQTNGGNLNHAASLCRSAVFAYLESSWGHDTPTDIGWLLVHLDWSHAGCRGAPSAMQVHQTRLALEDVAALAASAEASAMLSDISAETDLTSEGGEPSGVFSYLEPRAVYAARR